MKLDFLANLEYFTAFIFLFLGQSKVENKRDTLAIMFGFFLFTLLVQLYGARVTIVSTRRWKYRCYFVFRVLIEMAKVLLLVSVFFFNTFLWEEVTTGEGRNRTEWAVYSSFTIMSIVFSIITFLWTSLRIY